MTAAAMKVTCVLCSLLFLLWSCEGRTLRDKSFGHPVTPLFRQDKARSRVKYGDILDIWDRPLSDRIYHAFLAVEMAGHPGEYIKIEAAPWVIVEMKSQRELDNARDERSQLREMMQFTTKETFIAHLSGCTNYFEGWTLGPHVTVNDILTNSHKHELWDAIENNCQHFVRDVLAKNRNPPILWFHDLVPEKDEEDLVERFIDVMNHQSKLGLVTNNLHENVKGLERNAPNNPFGSADQEREKIRRRFGNERVVRVSVWWKESGFGYAASNRESRYEDLEMRKELLEGYC